MAATRGQKIRLARELGMFFAELGYIPSRKEYSFMSNRPKTITIKEIDRIMGSWSSLLTIIEREQKEVWNLIHDAPVVVQEVLKPIAPKLTIDLPTPPKIDVAKPAKAEKPGA